MVTDDIESKQEGPFVSTLQANCPALTYVIVR